MKKNVILAISGGVDSSVAAFLLKKQGYNVTAVFMKNWDEEDQSECQSTKDFDDAKLVCEKLDLPIKHLNFSFEYWENVFSKYLIDLKSGLTPNPDIWCNNEIKFKVFLDYAIEQGADYIATGHYANIKQQDGKHFLTTAIDEIKDQTYFIHGLNKEILPKILFPIGQYSKQEIRKLATELDLVTSKKPDSMGICFIGEKNYKNFIKKYIDPKPGEIRDVNNNLLGNHEGLFFYTIGQRKGLKIGGNQLSNQPWYVYDKDLDTNTLLVVAGSDDPLLYKSEIIVREFNWLVEPIAKSFECFVKIRAQSIKKPCRVEILNERIKIIFAKPEKAVTPGQYAVLYDNDICLGGGTIIK